MPLLCAALPVFLNGLLEDIGRHQSPRMRLAMAAASGLIAIWALGTVLPRVGLPIVDYLFLFLPIAVLFTIFATTGLVHAFNLVDGINGFAAFNALVSLGALFVIAQASGVSELLLPVLALSGAIVGFLPLNFPIGRLFLGDAGAYFIGFMLGWMAVYLVATQPQMTPWAALLVFFWPVADTFLAIARRRRRGSATVQPDRLHAHHVMMRALEIVVFRRKDRRRSNPTASAALVPFLLLPPMTAFLVWDKPLLAAVATFVYGALFVVAYSEAILFARRYRRRRVFATAKLPIGALKTSGR